MLYEHAFRGRTLDIEYFCDLAVGSSGPVLEYGCGSGRVTLPLARRGCNVVGVDLSQEMLGALRQKLALESEEVRNRVELRRGDMRRLTLDRKFPLILATFNVTAHLHTLRGMQAWLGRIKTMLHPKGELVFDVLLPAPEEIEADPDQRYQLPPFRHPQTKQWIFHDERYEYDPARQVLLVESNHWLKSRPQDQLTTRIELRQWFPKEIESVLRYEGFSVDLRADYTDMPIALCQDAFIVRARTR